MRVARHRYDRDSCYYHVFNRVAGEPGWYPFEEVEREEMLRIMRRLCKFYTIEVISFVCMGNHFHAVVRAPSELPGRREVGCRFEAYYGASRMAPDWRIDEVYEHYARRMRDVSSLMKDFQQQFTNWFNDTRPKGRRGRLWADRFKSLILEGGRALWQCIQYIEMNPVRAGLVTDPGDYRHSTWGILCGSGRHPFGVKLAGHLAGGHSSEGEPATDGAIIRQFRAQMARAVAREAGLDTAHVNKAGEAARKPAFSLAVTRRVRHWTDGAIIGSKLFVREVATGFYGRERVRAKRFDQARDGLVSFRQLRWQ